MNPRWLLAAALLGGCGSSRDDELDAQRAEIAALRSDVEALRTEVAACEHGGAAAPSTSTGVRVAYASEVHVAADEVVDEVDAYGEDAVIDGRVLGDATSFGGDVIVGPTGVVDGDVVSFGGRVDVDDDAIVRGDRVAFASDEADPAGPGLAGVASSLYHRLVFLLSFAGAGVLVVGLVPSRVARIAEQVDRHAFRSFLVGASAAFVLGLASFVFAVTIVGLPVSFLLIALLGLAWLMGFVGLCQALGDRLPFREKQHGRWTAFLLASIAITFLGVLPVVGWLVVLIASAIGTGAAIRSRFGGR
jgi:hypothetical protein